jgi:hypothetical protein
MPTTMVRVCGFVQADVERSLFAVIPARLTAAPGRFVATA